MKQRSPQVALGRFAALPQKVDGVFVFLAGGIELIFK